MAEAFSELIQISLAGINVPITLLLILTVIYWISVIFGALDIDIFDFDLDLEGDADADIDVQAGGTFQGMMIYFNIGSVPVTVWLTFLIFTCWILTVLECYYLNPGINILLCLAFVIPNLFIGMYLAKFATIPLKKVFQALASTNVTHKSLIGRRAVVTSSSITESFGQIEIKTDGAPITMNACTEGGITISRGETVILTKKSESGIFVVERFSEI